MVKNEFCHDALYEKIQNDGVTRLLNIFRLLRINIGGPLQQTNRVMTAYSTLTYNNSW